MKILPLAEAKAKLSQLVTEVSSTDEEITITRKTGSFTFEESLAKLVEQGVMDRNEARLRAPHPEEFDSIRS